MDLYFLVKYRPVSFSQKVKAPVSISSAFTTKEVKPEKLNALVAVFLHMRTEIQIFQCLRIIESVTVNHVNGFGQNQCTHRNSKGSITGRFDVCIAAAGFKDANIPQKEVVYICLWLFFITGYRKDSCRKRWQESGRISYCL